MDDVRGPGEGEDADEGLGEEEEMKDGKHGVACWWW